MRRCGKSEFKNGVSSYNINKNYGSYTTKKIGKRYAVQQSFVERKLTGELSETSCFLQRECVNTEA